MSKQLTAFPVREYIQAPSLEDFYKVSHRTMYKPGVTEVTINFTGRSGKHSNIKGGTTYRWAGLQHFINTIIVGEWQKFFKATKEEAVADYRRVNEAGLGVPCDTSHIEALHDLGYLPLEFRALKEGVAVPYGVAAMTCRNTHPDFGWLPNNIETILSDEIWPIQTSLTTATAYMAAVKGAVEIDGTPSFLTPFMCHDFSMRGMMGGTMAGGASLSGLGHLMAGFCGSDTLPAAFLAEKDYGAYLGLDRPFETIASVPATEHSVQCSFNGDDLAYFRHCMSVYTTGILSLVSDGYDFWKLITEVLPILHAEIMARDGKVVIRPDSGDPVKVVAGYKVFHAGEGAIDYAGVAKQGYEAICVGGKKYWVIDENGLLGDELPVHEAKGLVEVLHEQFGGTVTDKGYKLLDQHIGAIYGDSITLERQGEIYRRLHNKGYAIGNIVVGVGSYQYQFCTRDTHSSAIKATNIIIDGIDTPISKEVKGDSVKKSAKGRIVVVEIDGVFSQYDQQPIDRVESEHNEHQLVWKDGVWHRVQTLKEIRDIVAESLRPKVAVVAPVEVTV